jgi:TonB family protein
VEEDGSVSNVKILRGVNSYLDDEALRVVSLMPRWSPGVQNNQNVRVQYNLPIRFTLRGGTAENADNKPIKNDNEVYNEVQQQPKFPGDVNTYLAQNIVYPNEAKSNKIEGTVYVSFIVEKDGSVSSPTIFKSVDRGESLNKEALRVISMMPNWTPGMQSGVIVRTKYMLPVQFSLQSANSSQKQNSGNGSTTQTAADPDGNTITVDQKPEFKGNLLSFLAANLHYPEQSKARKIEGSVPTSFVVGTDGVVSGAKIEKTAPGREEIEKEAIRLIYAMPNWKPAMYNGQPVAVRLYISIPFFIDMDEE